MKKLVCAILTMVIMLSFPIIIKGAGSHGIQYGQPMGDDGTIFLTDEVADALAATGAGVIRVNFRTGNYGSDTAEWYVKYDEIINRLRDRGFTIIGCLNYETLWAPNGQDDWCDNNVEHGGTDGYNAYIDAFGYMAARIASHFEGRVKYWEIWNEPNCYSEGDGSTFTGGYFIYPSNFAALLAHVYTQLRYYNNIDCEVISGGLLGHDIAGLNYESSGAQYLSDTYYMGTTYGSWNWILANAGTYPLDHIGQHIYISQGGRVSASDISTYCDWVRGAYEAYEGSGTSKKIFMTEFGWETPAVSEQDQAYNIDVALNTFFSKPYIENATWFYLKDEPGLTFGLYRSSGLSENDKKIGWTNFSNKVREEGRYSNRTINYNIANYFNNNGGMAAFGSPFDNGGSKWVHYWDYGYVQDFRGGYFGDSIIMTSSSGTFAIILGFRETYLSGNNHHILRFPVSDEYGWGSGTRQDFQGGYMTWDPYNGVVVHPY